MGVVFGLYSTGRGTVRYVGQTEYTSGRQLDLIVTKALDREPGALYDWIRDEWRCGNDIRAYTLQDDIIPADLEIFESYWIDQFPNLLNAKSPAISCSPHSEVGRRVNDAILATLKGKDAE